MVVPSEQPSRYHRVGVVLYMLNRRYGPLPDAAAKHLSKLTEGELDALAARILTASTLQEALGIL